MSYISNLYDITLFLIKHSDEITRINYYYNVISFTYTSVKVTYDATNYIYRWITPDKGVGESKTSMIEEIEIDGEKWIEIKNNEEINLP